MDTKETNPKDAVGCTKAPMHAVPPQVLLELGLGMYYGGFKYGDFNYRAAGVRASIYYDATLRHLFAWWEGEDLDPDSGLSHITMAMTSLAVLRDAMMNRMGADDRPPRINKGDVVAGASMRLMKLNHTLQNQGHEPVAPYTEANRNEWEGT